MDSSIFPERHVRYGTFWERFGASFIDGLVLIIPTTIVSLGAQALLHENAGKIAGSILNIIIGWAYAASLESGEMQATLGKKAMKLKVTDMDGNRISFSTATGRHFAKYLSMLTLLIGYIMVAWDPKRQALHDKMVGTLIESTEYLP